MQELRSTDILDKEIQADARKKAERMLEKADRDCENLLASIEMYPDINVSFVEAKKFFNDLTIDYPKRRTAFFHLGFTNDDRDLVSILIKNGADENESAVMSLNEPYVYEFFFHGDQLKSYSLMNSW